MQQSLAFDSTLVVGVLGFFGSIVAAGVSLWTRASVAELKADLITRQEQRCAECKQALVSRHEFDQLDKRLALVQGRADG